MFDIQRMLFEFMPSPWGALASGYAILLNGIMFLTPAGEAYLARCHSEETT